ncbi:ABC transporter [Camelimonas fluminis]|uniref:ABC transporter ATP-binding protein n=1 Tax=Camelimonas fluminis TaxID=1576911 RepID=A0ABV7UIX2_9HYPH|nr:ABC transporter ATP-binding protein [Camelimonas fluminis]GHE58152.1 ABC transporter [Camelimonas fluminis]
MIAVDCASVSVGRKGTSLLRDISFRLNGAGFVGVLGPNGAGKSTLLRVLAGLRAPDAGEARWNGLATPRWPARKRAAFCGYLPQQFAPAWDYEAGDIIALGAGRASAGDASPGHVLARFGLTALARRRWSMLSGGERARVMLAATLATSPALVLADEPGASLDVRHKLDLLRRLRSASTSSLVVAVMHDLDLALRFCDRILLLEEGALVADCSPDDLLAGDALDRVFGLRLQKVRRHDDHDWVIGLG